jgi:hypothetical protein
MRFSLKWGLLGMAYVAVAAAAFGQGHWVYADLLWLATFLAVCLAAMTVIFGKGTRRAGAAGFALFALALAACAQFAPDSIPTKRILLAAGQSQYQYYPVSNPYMQYMQAPVASAATVVAPPVTVYSAPNAPAPLSVAPTPVPVAFPIEPVELPFNSKLRAANSLVAMIVGLAGCWIGSAAFRRQQANSFVAEAAAPLAKNHRLDNRPLAT